MAEIRLDLRLAREVVLRHGWNATAYQILNPGIDLWFSSAGDAVVGYVRRHGVRVVAGAPVCSHERLRFVAAEFEADALANGDRVCYFAAGERLAQIAEQRPDCSLIVLGGQPVWSPKSLLDSFRSHSSLRAQLNRSRNKGVRVREWDVGTAAVSSDLRRVLAEWLSTRGLPSLHFLVEPATLDRLFDRRIFVAELGGRPVGFAVATPIPARNGVLVEQIIRGTGAPNGTAELLLYEITSALESSTCQQVTLGLSPLSEHAPSARDDATAWVRATLAWIRIHGRRFYNFRGLDAFKAKFAPDAWEVIHAVSVERQITFQTLRAIGAAFGGTSAERFLLQVGAHALRREFGRLVHRS